ncbi:hepcidin-1-like [Pelobates fuscus]|uniref:hepcidin-1-like n=1 Tax=Pelobates fuscus TaxID=191477 RepID=UPI002FE4A20E
MKYQILCVLILLSALSSKGHCASLNGKQIMNSPDHITEPETEQSNIMGSLLRTKRQSHLSICTYCCNCCKRGRNGKSKGCGMCCLT